MSSKVVVSEGGRENSPWLIYEAVYLIPARVEGRGESWSFIVGVTIQSNKSIYNAHGSEAQAAGEMVRRWFKKRHGENNMF